MNSKEQTTNNMNHKVGSVTIFLEYATLFLFSAYFFTRGYVHSFQLPITIDFLESGYFMLTLITDDIFPVVFSIITNIWILIFTLIFFIIIKLRLFRKFFHRVNIYKKLDFNKLKIENMTPLKFFVGFIIFTFLLKIVLDWVFYFPLPFLRELAFYELKFDVCPITNKLNNLNIIQSTLCYIKNGFWSGLKFLLIQFPEKVKGFIFLFSVIGIIFSICS